MTNPRLQVFEPTYIKVYGDKGQTVRCDTVSIDGPIVTFSRRQGGPKQAEVSLVLSLGTTEAMRALGTLLIEQAANFERLNKIAQKPVA